MTFHQFGEPFDSFLLGLLLVSIVAGLFIFVMAIFLAADRIYSRWTIQIQILVAIAAFFIIIYGFGYMANYLGRNR